MKDLDRNVKYLYLLKDLVKEMYEYGIDMKELKGMLESSNSFKDVYNGIMNLMKESTVYEADDIERYKKKLVENIFYALQDDGEIKIPYYPTGKPRVSTMYEIYGSLACLRDTHGGIYKVDVSLDDLEFSLSKDIQTYESGDSEAYLNPNDYDKMRIELKRGTYEDILEKLSFVTAEINRQYIIKENEINGESR